MCKSFANERGSTPDIPFSSSPYPQFLSRVVHRSLQALLDGYSPPYPRILWITARLITMVRKNGFYGATSSLQTVAPREKVPYAIPKAAPL
jgi:hypothetical protein